MGIYARAVTDHKGKQLAGLDHLGLTARRFEEAPPDPFRVALGKFHSRRLGDLLSPDSYFHLLGSYLINELRIPANTPCRTAKKGIYRAVQVNGREYRSDSVNLYRRKGSE